jgi:hypothetical protein
MGAKGPEAAKVFPSMTLQQQEGSAAKGVVWAGEFIPGRSDFKRTKDF